MVVGQQNKLKVGAVIQARMKSTRLPGKILLPLPFNAHEPLLHWPIVQLKKSKIIQEIILATSTNAENNPLESFAKNENIHYFLGSESNVLKRFVEAAEWRNLDVLVRITGDNPIIDVAYIDYIIDLHINGNFDYSYSTGLPIGMNVEVVNVAALKEVNERNDLIEPDMEHVTYFFKRQNLYKSLKHHFEINLEHDLRLTVDYPADYATLNIIVAFAIKHNIWGIDLVKMIYEEQPWVFEVNNHLYQKKQFNSLSEELIESLEYLKKLEFNYTIDFLNKHLNNN